MAQPGFFDTENRLKKLDEKDNLLKLNQLVEWGRLPINDRNSAPQVRAKKQCRPKTYEGL
jgi:hypothetical protein